MAEETITVVTVPVTVDPAAAEDRGDNFVPTDDVLPVDNNGDSIDPGTAAPAPAPGAPAATPAPGPPAAAPAPAATPAAPAAAPAPAADPDDADELERQNGGRIPKGRFNEVNNERKAEKARADALAEENARLKAGQASAAPAPSAAPAAPEFDVNAQERAYAEAMLDGDVDKALGIRSKINDHIYTTAKQHATTTVTAELTQRQTAAALQEASNQALADFPFLDTPEGSTALRIIVATRDDFIQRDGMAPHLALKKAVAEIAPRFSPAAAPPSRELPAAAPAVDTRSAGAVARGAADSLLQPPIPENGIGNRATQARIDVKNLTEAQFEALPDVEKKKLRGD